MNLKKQNFWKKKSSATQNFQKGKQPVKICHGQNFGNRSIGS